MTEPQTLIAIDAEPLGLTVVARLEDALAQAKAGELSSVAIAIVFRNGVASHSWSDAPNISLLVGAIARLQAALIRSADE